MNTFRNTTTASANQPKQRFVQWFVKEQSIIVSNTTTASANQPKQRFVQWFVKEQSIIVRHAQYCNVRTTRTIFDNI